jgi:hypothetical protein
MKRINKKDNEIELIKEIDRLNKKINFFEKLEEGLNKKIDYLEELDRKYFLQLITLQNKVCDYQRNFIEYYKYEELQNDYINLVQVLNNKNKEANNE